LILGATLFIGHIPAGYISTKTVFQILPHRYIENIRIQFAMFWGIFGSIFPDLDMFYFYLIDKKQHLHHGYWTHIPFYWLSIILLIFLIFIACGKRSQIIYLFVFSLNIFIHLFLDTIVGKIRWLYPFSSHDFVFFHVPACHNWWVWNFIFHWTFLFEIIIVATAFIIIIREYLGQNKSIIQIT